MQISVIRLGHRVGRDLRTTTHVSLTSRALGANEIILCGEHEPQIEKTVQSITERWGGEFYITYSSNWKKTLREKQKNGFTLVHSTMYGEPIQKIAKKLQTKRKICIVVGAEKVPWEVYQIADYNISVTGQPHSETAALAIILHELQKGKELRKKFSNAKLRIVPQKKGKKVLQL
ncbi:MAG: tRNA (cytidine(56)-2'-O)-methyltransferase [Candidatus Micrarchaeota archaeon]